MTGITRRLHYLFLNSLRIIGGLMDLHADDGSNFDADFQIIAEFKKWFAHRHCVRPNFGTVIFFLIIMSLIVQHPCREGNLIKSVIVFYIKNCQITKFAFHKLYLMVTAVWEGREVMSNSFCNITSTSLSYSFIYVKTILEGWAGYFKVMSKKYQIIQCQVEQVLKLSWLIVMNTRWNINLPNEQPLWRTEWF